jgi:phosphonate transport system substrate-binding protein
MARWRVPVDECSDIPTAAPAGCAYLVRVPLGDESELVFATYLAPNIRPVYEHIAASVAAELGRPARLITGESFGQVRSAEVDFAFICGLPYVRLARETPCPVVLLAAPVLAGPRYEARPIYFSDVIVRADDRAMAFDDLRGRSWAYNEPDSHSGHLVTLFRLHQMGESSGFFSQSVMTGFHQESIKRVLAGEIDASAIDSQVLAVEMLRHPDLWSRLRIIDSLGPSTIQPLVAASHVPGDLRSEVLDVVLGISEASAGRAAFARGMVSRFEAVEDARYDDIRHMLDTVESAGLSF